MRRKLIVGTMLLLAALVMAPAQSRRSRAAKEFMRDKLELAQKILEGVTIEDWDMVIAKGTRLSAMTQEADWRVFENPHYDEQSKLFRRDVDSLVRAARKKDSDAATLAYVRMTMGCVDCHKFVRGILVATNP